MSTTDVAGEHTADPRDPAAGPDSPSGGVAGASSGAARVGVWSWSFVGLVVALIIIVTALGAVSEIVLPMTFAVVLAVIFKPMAESLERHKFKPTLPPAWSCSVCWC